MRATVIHNGSAGAARHTSPEAVVATLREQGYQAEHRPTGGEADMGPALRDPGDVVVVAGGDGTVRAVALALLEQPATPPLAVVPLGTSNNIARSLGLTGGDPLDAVRGLGKPRPVPFDVGRARGPWGERRFLESFGLGLLADLLDRYDPDAPKSVWRGAAAITGAMLERRAVPCRIEVDGERLEIPALVLELTNTPTVSNGLKVAPQASPSSGVLHLVAVTDRGAASLAADVVAVARGTLEARPDVTTRPVRRVTLTWQGSPVHLDAEVWPPEHTPLPGGALSAEIEVLPGALTVWVPGR